MPDPDGQASMVVVIDAGPSFFRKPTWAYGPFASVEEAERWVRDSAARWDVTLGGWEHRVVTMGTQGAVRVQSPGPGRA